MKHTKSILMAALAAITLGSIGSASAEVIYVTGSTAFRKAANVALQSALGAGNIAASDSATSLADTSAGMIYYTNCTVNGQTVDVAVSWSGSEAGIQSVASPSTNVKTIPFLDIAKLTSNSLVGTFGTNISSGVSFTTMTGNSNTTSVRAILTYADTFQTTSQFTGTGKSDGLAYTALTQPYTNVGLGVVPFTFVANKGCPYTDITTSIFADLYTGNGYVFGSEFSGNPNDTNIRCFGIGRNPDSGTRLTTFLVGKVGTAPSAVTQYTPTVAAGVITALAKSASSTINGIVVPLWQNGESSGGTLCKYFTNAMAAPGSFSVPLGITKGSASNCVIGYAGVSDAAGQYANGLQYMTFNGVAPRAYNSAITTNLDAGYTNIISGKYPFWCYEHLYYNSGIATAQATNLAATMSTSIFALPSSSANLAPNIALGDMKVSRSKDGGPLQ